MVICYAALLTRMSILPNSATARSMMLRPGHVTGDQDDPAARPFNQLSGVLCVVMLAQVGDDDVASSRA